MDEMCVDGLSDNGIKTFAEKKNPLYETDVEHKAPFVNSRSH